ncbi:MAG: helix-turn-helix domain-containing protein [Hyphomicrobium sp.]
MSDNSQPVELRGTPRVCKQLDCSPVTLWRRVHDPDLNFQKPIKISGRNYFRADQIDAWIEEQAEVA